MRLALVLLLTVATLVAQDPVESPASKPPEAPTAEKTPVAAEAAASAKAAIETEPAEEPAPATITVPAGTKVPLVLKQAVSTKSARVGDNVYLETTFPVTQNDEIVIPAGTYVQGVVSAVKRSPRLKGRAELLLHFRTMIFPNGYTVSLPGVLDNIPGADKTTVKKDEGTVEAGGTKGRDVGTIATTAGTGAVIGAVTSGGKGAAIGGLAGAAAGTLIGLLSRGDEVRLENGTAVEMELQRPLVLEEERLHRASRQLVPVDSRSRKLERPVLTPPPQSN